jgi:hypothetical protein
MFAAVAGWNWWVRLHASGSADLVSLYNTSYFGFYLYGLTWHDFLRMVSVNLRTLYAGICDLFLAGFGNSPFETVLRIVAIGAAVSGVVRFGRRTGCWQYPAFAIGFLLQLMVWNGPPAPRLLFPLLPLLLAGVATEIAERRPSGGPEWPGMATGSRGFARGGRVAGARVPDRGNCLIRRRVSRSSRIAGEMPA